MNPSEGSSNPPTPCIASKITAQTSPFLISTSYNFSSLNGKKVTSC